MDRLFNLEAEKVNETCQEHDVNLVLCPAENCRGCFYVACCSNKKFCQICADKIMESIKAGNQKIYHDEFVPVAMEYNKTKELIGQLEKALKRAKDKMSVSVVETRNRLDELNIRLSELGKVKEEIKKRMR